MTTQAPRQDLSTQQNDADKSEMRPKRNVFRILFLAMMAFGIVMGAVFPFLQRFYLNDSSPIAFSFVLMCLGAGITVGIANYILFSLVVSKELHFLVNGMNALNKQISAALFSRKPYEGSYKIEVKTDDMIGQVTQAFNTMSHTVEQRFAHEASFRDIVSSLSANVELDKTCETILRYFTEVTSISSGLLYGKIDGEMTLLSSHDIDIDDKLPQKLVACKGIISDTINSGEIHTIATEASGLEWVTITTPFGTLSPKHIRLIPLISKKSTVGLVIATCTPGDRPEHAQLETLKTYANYMAPYLQNALLHNKIQKLASYDSLTHVLNRRFGLIRLHEEFSASLRYHSDLSAIMIDIDKFKAVNDTYGHEAGDIVLKKVASTLANNLRDEEVICRYGGEEFLIVLPMANLEKAGLVAERLRGLVESQTCYYEDNVVLVSISLGVSSLSSLVTQNENDLINTADKALYHAKHMGRNRVALFRNNESVILPKVQ